MFSNMDDSDAAFLSGRKGASLHGELSASGFFAFKKYQTLHHLPGTRREKWGNPEPSSLARS